MVGFGAGCAAVEGREIPIGVSVLPAGTTAVGMAAVPELVADEDGDPVSELSCHRTHTRFSWHRPDSAASGSEASAINMSDKTPVGMSQMKVSNFTILETASATKVPSILPLSLLIKYSETQSLGPLPRENLRVYCA